MIESITVFQYTCDRESCKHIWQSMKNTGVHPRMCPKCKSVKWNDAAVNVPTWVLADNQETQPQAMHTQTNDILQASEQDAFLSSDNQTPQIIEDFDFGS